MNASYDWLREFCPIHLTPAQVRDGLTARCATVEEMTSVRADLAAIVIGLVVEAGPHPDSDHLSLTRVDDGSGTLLDVVCGAPNVRAGKKYPFARSGVTLPGGIKLERRKIRGVYSNGMLCSARELALGEEQDGILELETDAAPGTPFLDAVHVSDVRLGIDVLPNRPDLLSHVGVAREISSMSGVPLQMPSVPGDAGVTIPAGAAARGQSATGGFTIRVEDDADCPLYVAALVRGVTVGPSPRWLVDRLAGVGARSINNVVDVTNYMLHGFGQPMHAFDAARLAGNTVVVRRGRDDERLVTLDGVDRALGGEILVIADAQRPIGIAGVMGGRDSEVTGTTSDILLEVAAFNPKRVRRGRRALNLPTDASYRFERGTDAENAWAYMEHAVRLLIAVAGGSIADAPACVRVPAVPRAPIDLRTTRVAHVIGVPVPPDEIVAHLQSIGFGAEPGDNAIAVSTPSWRHDIKGEIDLIEEVARLHGYQVLADDVRAYRPGTVPDAADHIVSRRVRDGLVGEGLLEVRPMPFVAGDDATHLRVTNPLAENEAHLRRSVLETLSRRVEYNLAHMQASVRFFEIGAVFEKSAGVLPRESWTLGIVVMGDRHPLHYTDAKPSPRVDEWDAKALAIRATELAIPGATIELDPIRDGVDVLGAPLWTIAADGAVRGRVLRLALDAPPWAAPAFGIELVLSELENANVASPEQHAYVSSASRVSTRPDITYRPLPTAPAAEFDLALLVPDAVAAATVEAAIRKAGGALLERLVLFDEFRGAGVPPDCRSLAWRLTFRDQSRTLRDAEIDGRRQKILRTLESELGVRHRTS